MTEKRPLLILLLLLAVVTVPLGTLSADEYEKSVLTVEGRGEITVKPDLAYINVAVETNAATAGEAVKENSKRTNEVLSRIKAIAGPSDTVKTTSYNLQPVYEYDDKEKKSHITSYRVTSDVRLKTFRIEKLGEIIDSTTESGANKISGPVFDNSEKVKNKREALALAVKDARETARAVAEAAGVKIVKILRINPSYHYPVPVFKQNFITSRIAESADMTSIESGDLTVEASVSVVYEIEP